MMNRLERILGSMLLLGVSSLGIACGSSKNVNNTRDSGYSDVRDAGNTNGGGATGPTGPTGPGIDSGNNNTGSKDANNTGSEDGGSTGPTGPTGPGGYDAGDVDGSYDANDSYDGSGVDIEDAGNDGGITTENHPPTLDVHIPEMYQIPSSRDIEFRVKGEDLDGDRLLYRFEAFNSVGESVHSTEWSDQPVYQCNFGMDPQILIIRAYVRDNRGLVTTKDANIEVVNMGPDQTAKPIAVGCRSYERREDGKCYLELKVDEGLEVHEENCYDYGPNGLGSYHPEEPNGLRITEYLLYPVLGSDLVLQAGPEDPYFCLSFFRPSEGTRSAKLVLRDNMDQESEEIIDYMVR